VAGAGGGGAGDLRRAAPPSSSCGRGRTEMSETGWVDGGGVGRDKKICVGPGCWDGGEI
jgi:hypothetical protein